jgi:type VI secretion system secreted protein Hcp
MQGFFFSAPVSKASPKLMQSVADGSRFQEAVFTVRSRMGEQPVLLEVKLQDVGLTSYHFSGLSGQPTENFSLDFSKITYSYNVLDEMGQVKETIVGSWDLKNNTP